MAVRMKWKLPHPSLLIWCLLLVFGATPLAESEVESSDDHKEHRKTPPDYEEDSQSHPAEATRGDEREEFDNYELPTLVPPVDEDPLPIPPHGNEVGGEGAQGDSQVNREISGGLEVVPGLEKGMGDVLGDVLEDGLNQRSEGGGQRSSEGGGQSSLDQGSSGQDVQTEQNGADTLGEKPSQDLPPANQKGPPEKDGERDGNIDSQHESSSCNMGSINERVSSETPLEGSGRSHDGQDAVTESGSSSKDPGSGSDASMLESGTKCSEGGGCGIDKVQSPDGIGELYSDSEGTSSDPSSDSIGDAASDAEVGVATETAPSTGELGVANSHALPEAVSDQLKPDQLKSDVPAGDADSGETRTNVHTPPAEIPESADSTDIPTSADSTENQQTADSATTDGIGGELRGAGEEGEEGEEEEDDQVLTFEEFKKKMREQEGGQGQQRMLEDVATVGGAPKKTILSNYASFDCGAKVIETNSEAQNSMAILLENRDAYMINPCSANITFVVELCEMVSIRTLEIACFELFSSIPESFKIYSSESYPDSEWNTIGKFEVANERIIHSFPLTLDDNNIYAKYIKVEMLSHYGNEHYCPLSLLRVMGASMMEVYEESQHKSQGNGHAPSSTATLPPSEGFGEEDAVLTGGMEAGGDRMEDNGTLLRAAKDAVLRVLKKPLTYLEKMADSSTDIEDSDSNHKRSEQDKIASDQQKDEDTAPEKDGSLAGEETAGRISDGEGESVTLGTGSELPHEYSTITATSTGKDESHGVEEQVVDFDPQQAPNDAGIGEGSSNSATPLDSAQGQSPSTHHSQTRTQSGDNSGIEPAIPASLGPESNSVVEPSSIPALGPDLPGPESNAVPPPHFDYDSGCGQNSALGSCGSSVPADPTSPMVTSSATTTTTTTNADEPSVSSADSATLEGGVVLDGGDSDTCTGRCLDSESPKPENSGFDVISANGPELMQHHTVSTTTTTPVDTATDPSSDDKSDRERPRPPIDGTDPGSDVDVTTTTADGIGSVKSSKEGPAVRVGDTEASHEPTQDQTGSGDGSTHIPVNNDSMEMNEGSGQGSLSAKQPLPQTQLPINGSLLAKNADQAGGGGGGGSERGATPSDGSVAADVDRSDASAVPSSGDGNRTASSENLNGNQTEGVTGSGGVGFGGNGSVVQNQTEHGRNGNGTGLSNYGLPAQQREKSVFLRLSNNIEDLQANMTLFSDFLDQISSSLKKNKNKTEEATKWLDRRISSLNESLHHLKADVNSKLEVVSELRSDVLALMTSVSEMSHELLDLRVEVYAVVVVMAVLQLTLIFITLVSCTWQCYSNHSLRSQVSTLKRTHPSWALADQPPPPSQVMEVGSLEGNTQWKDTADSVLPGNAPVPSRSSQPQRAESAVGTFRRSSSTSLLSDLCKPSKKIQGKLSRCGVLGGGDFGGGDCESCGGMGLDELWPVSRSASNLENVVNSDLPRTSNFQRKKKQNKVSKK